MSVRDAAGLTRLGRAQAQIPGSSLWNRRQGHDCQQHLPRQDNPRHGYPFTSDLGFLIKESARVRFELHIEYFVFHASAGSLGFE
jgi:hypothetical protein